MLLFGFPFPTAMYCNRHISNNIIYVSKSVDRVLSVTAANFAKGSELLLSRRKATIVNGKEGTKVPF